jgi:hypothetical protein
MTGLTVATIIGSREHDVSILDYRPIEHREKAATFLGETPLARLARHQLRPGRNRRPGRSASSSLLMAMINQTPSLQPWWRAFGTTNEPKRAKS